MPPNSLLTAYWSEPSIITNGLILLHLAGALARVERELAI